MGKKTRLALSILAGAAIGGAAAFWLVGEKGRLIRPSTLRFAREGGLRRLLDGSFLHGYIYARWNKQYIGGSITHLFPHLAPIPGDTRWADNYHGKILTTADAKALISVDKPIPLQDLEQIIPYAKARDLVLAAHPDIVLYECPCRLARPDPCLPTQVCMVVGRPFTDFFLEHHPDVSRRVSTDEALAVLDAEHQRGHIHAAYFKDILLNRFFAICNCCSCCCGGVEAMTKRGVPMLCSSGYVAVVDEERCVACGACAAACPFKAIDVGEKSVISWDACMGCGVCEDVCPQGAISLQRDDRKGIPLDVRMLMDRQETANRDA